MRSTLLLYIKKKKMYTAAAYQSTVVAQGKALVRLSYKLN